METRSTPEALLKRIEEAARGLLFPSESDFPLTPLLWDQGEPTAETLLLARGLDASTPVERISVVDVFAPVLGSSDGDAARYEQIVDLLTDELSNARAYRIGRTEIEIVVLGQHPDGAWLGLTTKVVET